MKTAKEYANEWAVRVHRHNSFFHSVEQIIAEAMDAAAADMRNQAVKALEAMANASRSHERTAALRSAANNVAALPLSSAATEAGKDGDR